MQWLKQKGGSRRGTETRELWKPRSTAPALPFVAISQRGSDEEVVTAERVTDKAGPSTAVRRRETLHTFARRVRSRVTRYHRHGLDLPNMRKRCSTWQPVWLCHPPCLSSRDSSAQERWETPRKLLRAACLYFLEKRQ